MNVIICVDDNNGMMFNNRRQSKDSAVRQHIIADADGTAIWLNSYSAAQFKDTAFSDTKLNVSKFNAIQKPLLCIDEEFLDKVGEKEFAFVENLPIKKYENKIHQLILYKWNRKYPADFYFDIDIADDSWQLASVEEFSGSSHDKISKEVYIKH